MYNEIHPAVEAKNVQARRAAAGSRVCTPEVKMRRKATRAFLIRLGIALALVAGLWLAQGFDLISLYLAIPLEFAAMLWAGIWFGAWLQLMFCKRGLLL